jgi:hypothetical protein
VTDYRLSPDPSPKAEVVEVDGDAAKPEPATPIAPAPTANQSLSMSLAELREENIILRSTLHKLATALHSLADGIGADLDQAAARARVESDRRRRFQ